MTTSAQQLGLEGIAIHRSADFSLCRTWRYTLVRRWDDDLPSLLCVLLNPSTADEYQDDPTNTRCIRWCMRFGYGSLTFCNLFALRTPYPYVMMKHPEPIGTVNNLVIKTEKPFVQKLRHFFQSRDLLGKGTR